jgi:hypothetical protein
MRTFLNNQIDINPATDNRLAALSGRAASGPESNGRAGQRRIRRGVDLAAGGLASEAALFLWALRRAVNIPCAGDPGLDPRRIQAWDTDGKTASIQIRPLPTTDPVGFPPGMLHLLRPQTAGDLRQFCTGIPHMRPLADRLAGIDPMARTDEGARARPALANTQFNIEFPQSDEIIRSSLRHARDPDVIARAAAKGVSVDLTRPGLHAVIANACSATAPGGLPVLLTQLTNACHQLGAGQDEIVLFVIGPLANTAGDYRTVNGIFYVTLLQMLYGYLHPDRVTNRTPAGIIAPCKSWFTRAYLIDSATEDYSYARAAVPATIAHILMAMQDEAQARAALDSHFVDKDGDVNPLCDLVGPRVWGRAGVHLYRIDPEHAWRRLRAACGRHLAKLIA